MEPYDVILKQLEKLEASLEAFEKEHMTNFSAMQKDLATVRERLVAMESQGWTPKIEHIEEKTTKKLETNLSRISELEKQVERLKVYGGIVVTAITALISTVINYAFK